jgi:hypothetical protein
MANERARGAPPGNKNALVHGLHSYKAMLNGDGLDQRTSLFKALREKIAGTCQRARRRSITTRASHHLRQRQEYALYRFPRQSCTSGRAGGLICEPLKAVWPAFAGISYLNMFS